MSYIIYNINRNESVKAETIPEAKDLALKHWEPTEDVAILEENGDDIYTGELEFIEEG